MVTHSSSLAELLQVYQSKTKKWDYLLYPSPIPVRQPETLLVRAATLPTLIKISSGHGQDLKEMCFE